MTPEGMGKMLVTSSLSPLGGESRQAPLIFRDFGPSSVESLFPLQLSCAREERNLNPNHKATFPRESANSETELEPFIGSTLFLEVGNGVRVGVCACASVHAPKLNLKPRRHPTQCLRQHDSKPAGCALREGLASLPRSTEASRRRFKSVCFLGLL